MRRTLAATALLLSVWPGLGQAQPDSSPVDAYRPETTKQLLDLCTPADPPDLQAAAFCMGYASGVMDYHDAATSDPGVAPVVCAPDTVVPSETLQVFLAWARKNAQYWDEPPLQGLLRAASAEWPCKPSERAAAGND
jgi:hypothetical protein